MIFEIQIEDRAKIRQSFSGTKCIIGRSKNADLHLDYDGLSRKHMEIEFDGIHFFVTDLDSTNGVLINGEKIPVNTKTPYYDFFPIKIGPLVTISVYPDHHDFEENAESNLTHTLNMQSISHAPISTKKEAQVQHARIHPKAAGSKRSSMALLLLLLMGGGAYYLLVLKEDELIQPAATPETKSSTQIKKIAANIPPLDFAKIQESYPCSASEEIKICQELWPKALPFEGAKITPEGIFLFINIEKLLEFYDEVNSVFAKYPSDQKIKLILATHLLHKSVLSHAIKIPTIYAIGFREISGKAQLSHYTAFKLTDSFKLTDDDIKIILSYGINAGQTKFFDDYLDGEIYYQKL